ncbi:MAG: Crp/Fnr family transcriptional regulator [Arenicellales bacterium]
MPDNYPNIQAGERKILSNLFPSTQAIPELGEYQWKTQHFKAGEQLFTPGQPCNRFMLLAGGTVRIELQNPQTRSILLYRIEPGQLCIHSLINLISHEEYAFIAVAETDGWFSWANAEQFNHWMRIAPFQQWIFNNIGHRFKEVISRFADHAFVPLAARLADLLLEKMDAEQCVHDNQATLAVELGTAREMVSRQLSKWQKQGWVELHRGRIHINDIASLIQTAP